MTSSTKETSSTSLDALLAREPLGVAQALRHALGIATTLRSWHDEGRICGALSPSGIRLEPGQPVRLKADTDFTPYTAPEVLAGFLSDIRSDVYAFGAIVYYMLTGRQPFPGKTPDEVLAAAQEGRPAPLGPLAGGLPRLESVILRCLDLNPDRRWQNMRLISVELRLLCAAAGRLQPAPSPRPAEAEVLEKVARLEQELEARASASDQTLASVREAIAETSDRVRTAFEFVEDQMRRQAVLIERLQLASKHTDDVVEQVAASVSVCDRSVTEIRQAAAESAEGISLALQRIDGRLDTQSDSIGAVQAMAGRMDDLLECVVESIDSLQTFVL